MDSEFSLFSESGQHPPGIDPITGRPSTKKGSGIDPITGRPTEPGASGVRQSKDVIDSQYGDAAGPDDDFKRQSGDTGATFGRGSRPSGYGGRVSTHDSQPDDFDSKQGPGYDPNRDFKRQSLAQSGKGGTVDSRMGDEADDQKRQSQTSGALTNREKPDSEGPWVGRRDSYFDKLAQTYRKSIHSGPPGSRESGLI